MANTQKIRPIHPFAARMAPEIAFAALDGLPKGSLILDPMSGSGTVVRTISSLGYNGIGIDIDPLAVMMSKAWTTSIHSRNFSRIVERVLTTAEKSALSTVSLPWIDEDIRTREFIDFWFAQKQKNALRKLASAIFHESGKYTDLLKVALSKLIITKQKGASLAADVSHGKPHRVRMSNDFDVLYEYQVVCNRLIKIMSESPMNGRVKVSRGDARKLRLPDNSIDAIITSPPYLNAIDYMRGHKLALVWLGYKIGDLAAIKRISVGAERAPEAKANIELAKNITSGIPDFHKLPKRKVNMIYRYALDMCTMLAEANRVLKCRARATYVIGNTTQNNVYIENTEIAKYVAEAWGLRLINRFEREIPQNRRYLPPPTKKEQSSFRTRMKTEAVLTFQKT